MPASAPRPTRGVTAALLLLTLLHLLLPTLAAPPMSPLADPRAVVLAGHARFTVLTAHIIRLEYSATSTWQDAATIAIHYRHHPVPPFKTTTNATHTTISTAALTLVYLTSANTSFSPATIRVSLTLDQQPVHWSAANHEELLHGQLPGTVGALDQTNGLATVQLDCQYNPTGDEACTYGVVSRAGYSVIDDTHAGMYDNGSWPWLVPRHSYAQPSAQCALEDSLKRDCASSLPTINERDCMLRGCCWHAEPGRSRQRDRHLQLPGTPQCFYAADATQDLYFLGHGHDYRLAMKEFTAIAGAIPLPPRWAMGLFFSRWRAYGSYEEKDLVTTFARHDIPLDTLVSDMDWHLTFYKQAAFGAVDAAGETIGWSGFTFNPLLFDSHAQYLAWLRRFHLHSSMNIHPLSGIQPWEETHAAMVDAMGQTNRSAYVPFNLTDQRFMRAWFNITMRPLDVDVWWLDWNSGQDFMNTPRVTATYWIGYSFFTDPYHWANGRRPVILHRFGGLGQHRYPIGFSGDVRTSWESLAFQPYFTASASNVGFSFWSHDLGSFVDMPDPELFTRWLQWGAHSPVWRTHCNKQEFNTRLPWEFPPSFYPLLRPSYKLRQALTPYLYTAARYTHDTGTGIVLPPYYDWPSINESYTYTNSYLFGPAMYVSPVTSPVVNATGLANHTFWMPPGVWVNTYTGAVWREQGVRVGTNWTLAEVPAFARAGSVIPMLQDSAPPIGQALLVPRALRLMAYVGGAVQGSGQLYDDAGDSEDYLRAHGAYSRTKYSYEVRGANRTELSFTIGAANGSFPGLPAARWYEVWLRGVYPAERVSVNGVELPYTPYLGLSTSVSTGDSSQSEPDAYSYDGSTLSVVVYLRTPVAVTANSSIVVQLSAAVDHPALLRPVGYAGQLQRWIAAKIALDNEWGRPTQVFMDDYPNVLRVAQMGEVLTNAPHRAYALLNNLTALHAAACGELDHGIYNLRSDLRYRLMAQLCSA